MEQLNKKGRGRPPKIYNKKGQTVILRLTASQLNLLDEVVAYVKKHNPQQKVTRTNVYWWALNSYIKYDLRRSVMCGSMLV